MDGRSLRLFSSRMEFYLSDTSTLQSLQLDLIGLNVLVCTVSVAILALSEPKFWSPVSTVSTCASVHYFYNKNLLSPCLVEQLDVVDIVGFEI